MSLPTSCKVVIRRARVDLPFEAPVLQLVRGRSQTADSVGSNPTWGTFPLFRSLSRKRSRSLTRVDAVSNSARHGATSAKLAPMYDTTTRAHTHALPARAEHPHRARGAARSPSCRTTPLRTPICSGSIWVTAASVITPGRSLSPHRLRRRLAQADRSVPLRDPGRTTHGKRLLAAEARVRHGHELRSTLEMPLPQHGPGKKHERRIVLESWQQAVVDAHPWAFVRGLVHSDGCRITNWTTRVVNGERKRYEYPGTSSPTSRTTSGGSIPTRSTRSASSGRAASATEGRTTSPSPAGPPSRSWIFMWGPRDETVGLAHPGVTDSSEHPVEIVRRALVIWGRRGHVGSGDQGLRPP